LWLIDPLLVHRRFHHHYSVDYDIMMHSEVDLSEGSARMLRNLESSQAHPTKKLNHVAARLEGERKGLNE
jgi:hypothetical protein